MVGSVVARRGVLAVGLLIWIAASCIAPPAAAEPEPVPGPPPSFAPVEPPSPTPRPTPLPTPTPAPSVTVSATATWYCLSGVSRCTRGHSGGLYAAVSPDLDWLGSPLEVCTTTKCVTISVIDCNCQARHGIDLYSDAFIRLAPLSMGRISVTLTRRGTPDTPR